MPIFVDEVVISVDVGGAAPEGARPGGGGAQSDDKQALVAECVERVLEILAQKQER